MHYQPEVHYGSVATLANSEILARESRVRARDGGVARVCEDVFLGNDLAGPSRVNHIISKELIKCRSLVFRDIFQEVLN